VRPDRSKLALLLGAILSVAVLIVATCGHRATRSRAVAASVAPVKRFGAFRRSAQVGPAVGHLVADTRARRGLLPLLQRIADEGCGVSPDQPIHSYMRSPFDPHEWVQAPAQFDTTHATAPRAHPQDPTRAEMALPACATAAIAARQAECADALDAGAWADGAPLAAAQRVRCTVATNLPPIAASLPSDWDGDGGAYWWCDGGPTCGDPPDLPDDADGGTL